MANLVPEGRLEILVVDVGKGPPLVVPLVKVLQIVNSPKNILPQHLVSFLVELQLLLQNAVFLKKAAFFLLIPLRGRSGFFPVGGEDKAGVRGRGRWTMGGRMVGGRLGELPGEGEGGVASGCVGHFGGESFGTCHNFKQSL